PLIQWIGASKWVPMCSPVAMLLCDQKGPSSLKCATFSRLKSTRFGNGSGRRNVGVSADSLLVRSTIWMCCFARAVANWCKIELVLLVTVMTFLIRGNGIQHQI